MTDNLLPCPFCGSHASIGAVSGIGAKTGFPLFFVKCDRCNASTDIRYIQDYMYTEEEAIGMWNKRAIK